MVKKERQRWQQSLLEVVTDPTILLQMLALDLAHLESAKRASALFPLKVTQSYINRMQKGKIDDPLLLQVLPLIDELQEVAGYEKDPLHELEKNPVPGLLHKYHDRVLVTLTGACAIHCRYCFRRSFPYDQNNPGRDGWEKIFGYIKQHTSIKEVILSGGDPLVLNDAMLQQFTGQLCELPQITRLRVHTRLPIVLPERVTPGLIQWVHSLRVPLTIVLHTNHAREVNDEVRVAVTMLRSAGVHVLNQSVLLTKINDSVENLINLSETLYDAGVLPYYLHVSDKVQGAAHFDMSLEKAKYLHAEMTKRLSGYLVPRLVREDHGMLSKTGL